jgi:hypothetical protein
VFSPTFNGANSHSRPKCYEKATKMLQICYEFDCAPWVVLEEKMEPFIDVDIIVKHLIVNSHRATEKL